MRHNLGANYRPPCRAVGGGLRLEIGQKNQAVTPNYRKGRKLMSNKEEMIVLTGYFACVLLLWTPVIIDTIRQDRKMNKRGRK
jgi:hypothetical protein